MNYNFSNHLKENHSLLKEIIAKLNESFDYASVLACDIEGESYRITNKVSSVEENKASERGYVFRVYKNGGYHEYSTDVITSVEDVVEKITNSSNISGYVDRAIYVKSNVQELYEEATNDASYDRISDDGLDCSQIIKKCQKAIRDLMEENEYVVFADYKIDTYLVSKMFISKKKDIKQVYNYALSNFKIRANKDNSIKTLNFNNKANSLIDLLKDNNKKIEKLSSTAINLLDASKPVYGEYDCILSPSVSGLLARKTLGEALENDLFTSNRSKAKLLVKEKICSYKASIINNNDDTFFFDDEGNLLIDSAVMNSGVLCEGFSDSISSASTHHKDSGNGVRASYKKAAYSRAITPYFEAGSESFEDILKSINSGYLIDYPTNSFVDTKTLTTSINCLIGYEIIDGKFTGRIISPLTFFGNAIDIISSIARTSKEIDFTAFDFFSKNNSNLIHTYIGGPYLKVKVRLG